MIPILQHSAHLLNPYTLARVAESIDCQITMDEAWSPRIQATLTLPAADAGAIGMWGSPHTVIEYQTRYGPGLTLADLTAAYGGSIAAVTAAHGGSIRAITDAHTKPWHPQERIEPLSAATARWGGSIAAVTAEVGGSIAAITRALRSPGGSYRIPPAVKMRARLRARRIAPDDLAGTVTVELASEDVRLHDYRRTLTTTWISPHTSLRQLVEYVLRTITDYGQPGLLPGPDTIIPAGVEWLPGRTAWEILAPVLEACGWQLYAGLDAMLRLEPRIETPAPYPLDEDTNLIDYRPEQDYAGAFYEGAILEYTDAPDDDPALRYDVYAPPWAERIAHETRPGVRAVPGAAEQLVGRSVTRGRTGTATSHATLTLRPGHRVRLVSGGREDHGTIEAITWPHPDPETRIKLRSITPTP